MPTESKRPPITHDLKCWPESFGAIWSGKKRYDLRKNDRDYRVGDYLLLQEYNPELPEESRYTGRCVMALVTYMTPGGKWELPINMCVLGVDVVDRVGD